MKGLLLSMIIVTSIGIIIYYNAYNARNEVDPNFHIYLCFGQSNMEGQGDPDKQDFENVPERFQMMAAIDYQTGRKQGQWYKAVPPTCRDSTRLGPADYFGRHLVELTPNNVRIGIINVAIGGTSITLFDPENCKEYIKTLPEWQQKVAALYGNNPFVHLVERGREAQQVGVIKGFLMHQGEDNQGDTEWPQKVQKVYNNFLRSLKLKAEDAPLIVGELGRTEMGFHCGEFNKILNTLPSIIPTCHIVSSEGLPGKEDGLHFTTESYRTFGARYADVVFNVQNKNNKTEFLKE